MFFIDPQNEVDVLGSYDRLFLEDLRTFGCSKIQEHVLFLSFNSLPSEVAEDA